MLLKVISYYGTQHAFLDSAIMCSTAATVLYLEVSLAAIDIYSEIVVMYLIGINNLEARWFNRLLTAGFRNFGLGRRTLRLSLALSSLVGAIGRACLRKEVGLLRPGPRGPKVLRHQMVRWSAGGTEYPRWWHRQVGRQQFCSVF